MARGINKVILIGNLGGDPECRYTPNGTAVANVSLATSNSWKDKQTGQVQERTEWHRVVFFGRIAEVVTEYARKGSKLYIEGRLQTREWEKDGEKRYMTEVVVDAGGQMQLLDGAPQGRQQDYRGHSGSNQRNPTTEHNQPDPDYDGFDDSIPFD